MEMLLDNRLLLLPSLATIALCPSICVSFIMPCGLISDPELSAKEVICLEAVEADSRSKRKQATH